MRVIRLFCAAGMSTSLLVSKMQKYAEEIGYDVNIAAASLTEAAEEGKDADIILLGPQVKYKLKDIRNELPGKIVEPVDMRAYGMMDGKKVIEQVKKLLGD